MRNLTISARLTLGFCFVIILVLMMSAIGAWRIIESQQDNHVLNETLQTNTLIQRLARQVSLESSQAQASLAADPDSLRRLKSEVQAADQRIGELLGDLRAAAADSPAATLVRQIEQDRAHYVDSLNKGFASLDAGNYGDADTLFNQELPNLTIGLLAAIDRLSQLQDASVQERFDDSAKSSQLGLIVLGAATLLALLLGPLFAWRVTRSITHPLRHAVQVAEAVAQRNLHHRIEPKGKDEIASLEIALRGMVRGLNDAVGEVRSGANAIASAAAQITSGNLDLSSRTEQQASSLAQTAATMEELTATVRQNADNAQQANTLATSASQVATDGGAVVSQVVKTMAEINSTAQQVADIIGVIDSIAFQTNILALNAAVEAARAGEQGRGFAVVASEVRALAQRSAAAAKEIKALIDASVAATAAGNEQAAKAGKTMEEVVAGINRVTDIMGEISAANREQTTGIEEVNAAVAQMDDVTRQNASLVEESAAAAASLQTQADTLARLVATFRLSGQASGQGTPHSQGTPEAADEHPPAPATRLPTPPEKVVSPPPQRPASSGGPATRLRPALGAPVAAAAAADEWTEF